LELLEADLAAGTAKIVPKIRRQLAESFWNAANRDPLAL
jgi:hypothetical protein